MVRLKDLGDGLPHLQVLVTHHCAGPMVEVRAKRKTQLRKELWLLISMESCPPNHTLAALTKMYDQA